MKKMLAVAVVGLAMSLSVYGEESKEAASYPLKTCVVSGEKLEESDMGKPIDYTYKGKDAQGNETSRLVRLCCKSCIKKFQKDPEKYLKLIDAAKK